jgi:hypothetical protein
VMSARMEEEAAGHVGTDRKAYKWAATTAQCHIRKTFAN